MNPGKLIDPIAVYDPTENLRIGPGYQPAKTDHLVSVSARSRLLQRRYRALRGRRRLPQAGPRHHVPELHGDARREALHPRPRAPAVGDDAGQRAAPTAGATRRSTKPSTSAFPARPARPSARSTSTWPRGSPSSSPTTTRAACIRCITTRSASWIAGQAWLLSRPRSPTFPATSPASTRSSKPSSASRSSVSFPASPRTTSGAFNRTAISAAHPRAPSRPALARHVE